MRMVAPFSEHPLQKKNNENKLNIPFRKNKKFYLCVCMCSHASMHVCLLVCVQVPVESRRFQSSCNLQPELKVVNSPYEF